MKLIILSAILMLSSFQQTPDARLALHDRIGRAWNGFVKSDEREVEILLQYNKSLIECPPKNCFDVKRIDLLKEGLKIREEGNDFLKDALKAEQEQLKSGTPQ